MPTIRGARIVALAACLMILSGCLSTMSDALGVPTSGVLSADYKDGEQIRVAAGERYEDPFPAAFDRVVEMVTAQGYARFALIRNKCRTTTYASTNTPLGTHCVLWAQMLGEGETAEPKGSKDEVVYFTIAPSGRAIRERE